MLYLKNGVDIYGNNISILIKDDFIEKIVYETEIKNVPYEYKEINVNRKVIMPGVIDIHTHMREPGITHKEDFETGSRACAKGGITTFYDMPNTIPPTTTMEELIKKKELAKRKSIVNYGFHFGGSKGNNCVEIKKVLEKGEANSTKIFMNVTTGEMLIENDNTLKDIFLASKLVLVHAEEEMIIKAMELNKSFGKGLYVCHIPSKKEMEMVIKGKKDKTLNSKNHPIYAEVTPHHLFLNESIRESNPENKMLLRMKPELRSEVDNEFLWKMINEGYVDTIGTDHAPHLIEEKLEKITFGMPGVETSLALMLDAASKGKTDYSIVQRIMCENPAKIMKIIKRGEIKEGYYADLIVVDLEKEWVVGENLISKCQWSPYKGWKLKGKNILTIVNGSIVYNDDEFYDNINGKEIQFYE